MKKHSTASPIEPRSHETGLRAPQEAIRAQKAAAMRALLRAIEAAEALDRLALLMDRQSKTNAGEQAKRAVLLCEGALTALDSIAGIEALPAIIATRKKTTAWRAVLRQQAAA